MIKVTVTQDEFDSSPKCPYCGAGLQRNPYDYRQKYCPNGSYAIRVKQRYVLLRHLHNVTAWTKVLLRDLASFARGKIAGFRDACYTQFNSCPDEQAVEAFREALRDD